MKKSYSTKVTINAKPEEIWDILTDASGYPEWNSTVDRVEGEIQLGGKIKVWAKISPDRAFPVKVSTLNPNSDMTWTGGMPLGLFKGERVLSLRQVDEGTVEFSMQEDFTGLLSGMICKSMPDLQPAFDDFAADLKRTAEAAA